ncbi:3'(2'),5'-bisphosphate nucleotidase CysQ [Phenylobacterium sp.]|uniref:3'(2'),5'-bisphosphate nucleotidase CysQ n=1 Tax=Phenylobacterium sp. TaxID=1871053 RepID=UPI0025FDDBFF|nr:3'(2'),5'-bisphosphate nucleotidase CysQ [Phenylobacterium sp.]MBX3485478.1 3'(2'),5'-bisphosphate nucleotidase CysQ [Phenylobacterium sp.]MCW5759287.1 3'(2'),5'-bisphosphate nucleotidase CysQ [Phenylobacterium sp.]
MTTPIASDADLAAAIAEGAGRILLELQRCGLFEAKALGAAGDQVAQAFIAAALKTHRPDDAVLSEEAAADESRLASSRVWIVDPLDGTREYSERRSDWAVHVALSVDGHPQTGAVALPGLDLVLRTDAPAALPAAPAGAPRMLVSRTRPAPQAVSVAEKLKAELVPMGSAGAKAMAVLRGEAEIYLHAGGQYEWDSCAPVAVALAAGLHVSRIDGSPCRYNAADPYMPDLLVCRPELAQRVLEAVGQDA